MSVPDRITATAGQELRATVDALRGDARARGAIAATSTFRTADGEVTLDWRDGDWLRVTLTGDGPERTHVLPPDWPCSA